MKACRVETGTVNGSRAGVSVCEEPHLPGRTRKKNLCLKNLPLRTIEAHDEADFYKSPCQRSRSHSRQDGRKPVNLGEWLRNNPAGEACCGTWWEGAQHA